MRTDQDRIEIVDTAGRVKLVSESHSALQRPARFFKSQRILGDDQANSRDERDRFEDEFNSIFNDR